MRVAHEEGMNTSCTMLIGHIEFVRERIEHMSALRDLQDYAQALGPHNADEIEWTNAIEKAKANEEYAQRERERRAAEAAEFAIQLTPRPKPKPTPSGPPMSERNRMPRSASTTPRRIRAS